MSWAAISATVIGAALAAGTAYATRPEFGDPGKTSRRVVMANLKALPDQRKVEAAARLGEEVTFDTGRKQRVKMPIAQALEEGWITQAQHDNLLRHGRKNVKVKTTSEKTVDFAGYGDADIQGGIQRGLAEGQLELQQKYGEDFIREALKQQEMADPEGTAARKMLAEEINQMADQKRERPVADLLDEQIGSELGLGRGIDDDTRNAISSTISRRGGTTLSTGDVESGMEEGLDADVRLQQRLAKALGYYGSGATPADVDYRTDQQNMANMASFLQGQTPQSQFKSLAGGQQGATPTPQAAPLPGVSPNLGRQGQAAALQNFQLGVQQTANQVSPWFAGLGAIAKGAQVGAQAGAFGGG